MKKHLSAGCALIFSALPGWAVAIGFGTPGINSYLGEPLRVSVPLLSVAEGDLDELRVSLAARSWYRAAGLEYPEIAEQLLIGLDLSSADAPAVTVTTANPVDQIMVSLVLELNWPNRVMRNQLTVLLNPVEYQSAQLAEDPIYADGLVEAAGTVGVIPPALDREKTLASDTVEPVSESMLDVPSSEAIADTIKSSDSGSVDATTQNVATTGSIPDTVVVKAGDSLSIIVDRYLPAGADRYQGRMAFYDANPGAFYNGEIHHLIKGAELTVPAPGTILDISSKEARSRYLSLAEVVPQWSDSLSEVANSEDALVNDGFRLSLIELPEQAAEAPVEFESRVAQSGQLNDSSQSPSDSDNESVAGDNPLIADAGANARQGVDKPEFEMQGFSMKLTVMNAYIVELQDENRQLKERVAVLEERVEQLVKQTGQDARLALSDSTVPEAMGPPDVGAIYADLSGSQLDQSLVDPEKPVVPSIAAPDESEGVATEAVNEAEVVPEGTEAIEDTVADLIVSQLESEQVTPALEAPMVQAEVGSDGTASPRIVFRNELWERAKSILGPLNTPIVQLLLAILVMGFLLLAWMLRREKKHKHREVDVIEQEVNVDDVPYTEGEGVSYEAGNTVATLDLNDTEEPWTVNREMTEADLDNLQESAVDPITQSEVYLTYNRPQQAIEVLWEEYAKPDSDKFVVAKRILKVYQSMGDNEHRNASMRNFIVSLNDDIEVFSRPQWDELREELDVLRKTEQADAIEGVAELDQAYQLESKDPVVSEQRKSPELPSESDVLEALDDGLIELEYDVPDEAQAR